MLLHVRSTRTSVAPCWRAASSAARWNSLHWVGTYANAARRMELSIHSKPSRIKALSTRWRSSKVAVCTMKMAPRWGKSCSAIRAAASGVVSPSAHAVSRRYTRTSSLGASANSFRNCAYTPAGQHSRLGLDLERLEVLD